MVGQLLVVVAAATLALITYASAASELSSPGNAQELCSESSVVPLVTECAKKHDGFLQCVARREAGPLQQCECIIQHDEMQNCIGPCLSRVYDTLCARPWVPSQSKYLKYKPSSPLLAGVDGVYLINLHRRQDRLYSFFQRAAISPDAVHVMTAFDGRELHWSSSLHRLFANNRFYNRRAIAAKALSHFTLWRHIATTKHEYHLILEDDAHVPSDFVDNWNSRMQHAFPVGADVVFLGGLVSQNRPVYYRNGTLERVSRHFNKHLPTTLFTADWEQGIDPGQATTPTPAFHYRSVGYMLSSRAAKTLVDMVAEHGLIYAPDVFLLKAMRRWHNVYAIHPLVANEPPVDYTLAGGRDSDTQFDHLPIADEKPAPSLPEPTSAAASSPANTQPSPPPSAQEQAAEPNVHPVTPDTTKELFVTEFADSAWTLGDGTTTAVAVISLPDDTERRTHFKLHATETGLSVYHHTGNDGNKMNMEQIFARNIAAAPLKPEQKGQIGRTLSHLLLFELLAKADASLNYLLVLEDDVQFDRNARTLVSETIMAAPSDWDVISFGCHPQGCAVSHAHEALRAGDQCSVSSSAYVVRRTAASKLLIQLVPIRGDIPDVLSSDSIKRAYKLYCAASSIVENKQLPSPVLDRQNG